MAYIVTACCSKSEQHADCLFLFQASRNRPGGMHHQKDAHNDHREAKQVAAQKKLQAEIEQEQKTMETQQQAERQRIQAEAEAAVAKIDADAAAYAIKVKSEAEAAANKLIAESLTEELIAFNEVQQWNGALPTYVAGGAAETLPIIDMTGAAADEIAE